MDWRRPDAQRRPEPPKPPAKPEPPKGPAKPEPPKGFPMRPQPKPDDKNAEIEKKLDRLLKEIEDIRKEIRRPSR
jgi:hypothetical protein